MIPQSSIAHYRITTKLGEGGIGAVHRATDTKLNREVAIKVLPESFANDPDRMRNARKRGPFHPRSSGAGVAESPEHRHDPRCGRPRYRDGAGRRRNARR